MLLARGCCGIDAGTAICAGIAMLRWIVLLVA